MPRCKPGDLAVIVGESARHPKSRGVLVDVLLVARDDTRFRLVEVLGLWPAREPTGVCRLVGAPGIAERASGPPMPREAQEANVPDANLRPIRDPGDDAVDETLAWRSVPQKVEA